MVGNNTVTSVFIADLIEKNDIIFEFLINRKSD